MTKILTPLKAIRRKCLDCCGCPDEPRNQCFNHVKTCPLKDCALWPYRFGMRVETAFAQGRDVK